MSTKENILKIIPKNNFFNNSVREKCFRKCNQCTQKYSYDIQSKNCFRSLVDINKTIQNTVRVPQSLYIDYVSALAISKSRDIIYV